MNRLARYALVLVASLVTAACSSTIDVGQNDGGGGGGGGSCGDIAGGYAIDEQFEGTCPSTTPITDSLSVTVTGAEVKLTNGSNFLVHCTLSGCDCTTKSGDVFKFTADGFSDVETSSGCTTTMTGTKK